MSTVIEDRLRNLHSLAMDLSDLFNLAWAAESSIKESKSKGWDADRAMLRAQYFIRLLEDKWQSRHRVTVKAKFNYDISDFEDLDTISHLAKIIIEQVEEATGKVDGFKTYPEKKVMEMVDGMFKRSQILIC